MFANLHFKDLFETVRKIAEMRAAVAADISQAIEAYQAFPCDNNYAYARGLVTGCWITGAIELADFNTYNEQLHALFNAELNRKYPTAKVSA